MIDPERQAAAIYDLIRSTSGDRPTMFWARENVNQKISEWQAGNPALMVLREAEPAVHLAVLQHCYEWLKAHCGISGSYAVCQTLGDGIGISLRAYAQPLPAELIFDLFREYLHDHSMARLYFPLEIFLSRVTKEQITEETRTALRRIHLQLAPSPTGKIDPQASATRLRIAELIYQEGDKQLDPGRGPWSQIVFDELKGMEAIRRSGWEELLEHCKSLKQPAAGAKWKRRTDELVDALGNREVSQAMLRWMALGPTPGQPSEARSPIEDSDYQKGMIWCLASLPETRAAVAIGDFGIACLRKVPMLGAVSQKVGLACVKALGAMSSREAIAQLTRMHARIKYPTVRKLIDKALLAAAKNLGVTVHELADMSVASYGLDEHGMVQREVGDAMATIQLFADGRVAVVWRNESGKVVRNAPAGVKKAFASEVRGISASAKEIEQAYRSQKVRLEESLLTAREMGLEHWREYFFGQSLLGFLGRRSIWVFRAGDGTEQAALWVDGEMRSSTGEFVDVSRFERVRLWHPLAGETGELQRWREFVYKNGVRQPFRQAFREFYQVTDAERGERRYSNRFAGVWMRQHQLASLCRERGWDYRLMGAHFDGSNVPTKKLDEWKMATEFCVDLPSDRDRSLIESALGEQSDAGINLFVGSDQVRFYREGREIKVEEVPALVYSEIMRDVDLFTSVCAVGEDESWSDQGERGTGIIFGQGELGELAALIALRVDMLSRVLPQSRIADRCKVVKSWLEVRGTLGTYRIAVGWGAAALMTEDGLRFLSIPSKLLDEVELELKDTPMDLDFRAENALRKAYLLAEDWKITDAGLVKQLGGG